MLNIIRNWFSKIKNNVVAEDDNGNIIKTNYAEYFQFEKILRRKDQYIFLLKKTIK